MDKMIKYRHPFDSNNWFVQKETDQIPTWAVDVQPFDTEHLEVDKGFRCDKCRYGKLKDYGYSNYTVEGTMFSCVLEKHPEGSFDRFYGEDKRLAFANICERYVRGTALHISVEGDDIT